VLPAINFDHKEFFQTDKIDNVLPDWALSTKLITVNLTEPQMSPEKTFNLSGLVSQLSGALDICFQTPILTFPRRRRRKE
jgi:hypothetical protein